MGWLLGKAIGARKHSLWREESSGTLVAVSKGIHACPIALLPLPLCVCVSLLCVSTRVVVMT